NQFRQQQPVKTCSARVHPSEVWCLRQSAGELSLSHKAPEQDGRCAPIGRNIAVRPHTNESHTWRQMAKSVQKVIIVVVRCEYGDLLHYSTTPHLFEYAKEVASEYLCDLRIVETCRDQRPSNVEGV